MKRLIVWIIAALTVLSLPVAAMDLSQPILRAGQWPKPFALPPGAVKILAPPGTIDTVEVWSRGTLTGTNSRSHWVWAMPTSDGWCYIRACNCKNPITGSLSKPQPPKVQTKVTISSSIEVEQEARVEMQPAAVAAYFPPTRLEQKPYNPPRLPEWEVKSRESLTVSAVWVPTIRVLEKQVPPVKPPEPPKPPVPVPCPPGEPPAKPPTTGPVLDPSGPDRPPIQLPPPSGSVDNGTSGASWDPPKTHANVADPIVIGSDGVPVR